MTRAITLHQPWASLIAIGVKGWETRSRPCPPRIVGTRITIHAAVRPVVSARFGEVMVVGESPLGPYIARPGHDFLPLPLGAVVCTVVVAESLPIVEDADDTPGEPALIVSSNGRLEHWPADVDEFAEGGIDITDQLPHGDWTPGRWAWRLTDVQPVDPPVPAKGSQGWWSWEDPR